MNFLINFLDPKFLMILEAVLASSPFVYGGIASALAKSFSDWYRSASRGVNIALIFVRSFVLLVYIFFVFVLTMTMSVLLTNFAFLDGGGELATQFGFVWLFAMIGNNLLVVVTAVTFGFVVLCAFWRRFLFCFPIFMGVVAKIATGHWQPKKFAKIIDYGYYLVAAVVLFNLIAAACKTRSNYGPQKRLRIAILVE